MQTLGARTHTGETVRADRRAAIGELRRRPQERSHGLTP